MTIIRLGTYSFSLSGMAFINHERLINSPAKVDHKAFGDLAPFAIRNADAET